jgi:general L-amino acid transport system substrate-binding protein
LNRSLVLAAVIAMSAHGAVAGEVADRVRRDGIVRCVSAEHPGLAEDQPNGGIGGVAVDLCRAVAIAVLGPDGRIRFWLDGPALDGDVVFYPKAEIPDGMAAGPVVLNQRLSVLVPMGSRVRSVRDLARESVCLTIGSPEQTALETAARDRGIDIVRLAFEEDDEMRDAYAVGRCGALVGSETALAEMTGPIGINQLRSRLLPEPLSLEPVIVAAPARDPAWADLIFQVVRAWRGERASGSASPAEGASVMPPSSR